MDYNIYKSYDITDETDYTSNDKNITEDGLPKKVQSSGEYNVLILLLLIFFLRKMF